MLNFPLPVWKNSIVCSSIGFAGPENIGVAVEIAFLSSLVTYITTWSHWGVNTPQVCFLGIIREEATPTTQDGLELHEIF